MIAANLLVASVPTMAVDPLGAGVLRAAELRPAVEWFLDLPIDARAFDPTTFTKNRDRLLTHEIADRFFAAVVAQAELRRYLSSEHFPVDGTLLEAWASHKSFEPKDGPGGDPGRGGAGSGGNAEVDFRGQPLPNRTQQPTTDPEARLARKSDGRPAKLCYAGHLLMEHRPRPGLGHLAGGRLVGATIVAARVGEMIALPALALRRCAARAFTSLDSSDRDRPGGDAGCPGSAHGVLRRAPRQQIPTRRSRAVDATPPSARPGR